MKESTPVFLFCYHPSGFFPRAMFIPLHLLDQQGKTQVELIKSHGNYLNLIFDRDSDNSWTLNTSLLGDQLKQILPK